jgi:bacterioferritin-associated ferredoxin
MVICLCNCLKSSEIACARDSGGCSVSQIFKRLGCEPQCGKCVPYIRDSLRASDTQSTAAAV